MNNIDHIMVPNPTVRDRKIYLDQSPTNFCYIKWRV